MVTRAVSDDDQPLVKKHLGKSEKENCLFRNINVPLYLFWVIWENSHPFLACSHLKNNLVRNQGHLPFSFFHLIKRTAVTEEDLLLCVHVFKNVWFGLLSGEGLPSPPLLWSLPLRTPRKNILTITWTPNAPNLERTVIRWDRVGNSSSPT